MEKYTQFRDKSTGISPFLPISRNNINVIGKSTDSKNILTNTVNLIFKSSLFTLRIIIITPFVLLSIILSFTLGYSNYFLKSLNRFILILSGLHSLEYSVQNLKLRNVSAQNFPKKNEMYFLNFSNPLDFLILSIISNTEFIILIPNSKGQLEEFNSFLKFVSKALCGFNDDIKGDPIKYKNLQDKTIYIFGEGTTSNGKSILPFSINQEQFNEFIFNLNNVSKINSLGIRISPTLTTPLETPLAVYIWRILSNWSFNYKVRLNLVDEKKPFETNLTKIRSSLGNNGKIKVLGNELTYMQKIQFIKSYKGPK
ncbi:hypothetical protein WICMUC_002690 [Wickerhamomyces mucosus]|uniref:Uncharacterized protein n=1 Tax=Wickerhamomyces mucosus TaxID=1378264 RepID=A0A9P8TE60_9ASCO|nr:hypothetical protein WICMUC_002690 [Wickerhamomyces mucosus]